MLTSLQAQVARVEGALSLMIAGYFCQNPEMHEIHHTEGILRVHAFCGLSTVILISQIPILQALTLSALER